MAGYNVEQFWKVKDKTWLTERKAKWQRIAARFRMLGATGSEIRLYEQYYVKGNLKFVDNRQYGMQKQPELSLAEQLAWHPSADEAVWWQVVAMNAQEFDYFEEGYRFLGYNGVVSVRPEEYSPEIDNTVLNGRDVELYQFLFRNTAWLQYIQQLKHSDSVQSDFRSARHELETELSRMLSILDENVLKQIILFDSLPLQCLPHLHESYTINRYESVSEEQERFATFCGRFKRLAGLYADREHQPAQQRQIIEAYAEQLEKSAPQWQALWQQLKNEALTNYHPPGAVAESQQHEPEEPELTCAPDTVATEPWPDELVALKQHLEQQGYPVTTTEADANAILQQHFANRCVYFGSFIESMQLEAEDYDKPYPAFTAPLQALCDIKGDAKLSYIRRGERITIKVNGVRVGVADLEEPAEDEDTSAYFAAIIRLAQQWFGQQVFVYGYESLHLYILPTELVGWLEANGFTNSLNYFGGAATADQPLAGVTLVFTGVFSAGSREEMEYEAEQLGANVQKTVNSKTNYLVCGSKVGASKLAKAEALRVKVLSETEYQAMSSQGDSDPNYRGKAQISSWQVVAKKLKDIELQLFESVRNGLDLSYQQGLFATESGGDLILSVTKNFISRRGWIRVGFSPLGRELRLHYEALAQNGISSQDELTHTVTLSTKWRVNQDELDELLLLLCQMTCDKLKWVNDGGR